MKLIVGLGNPGKEYEKTRHNAGFLLVDMIQHTHECSPWKLSKKFNAEISEGTIGGAKVILAKPMTFMNNSGQSVGLLLQYYSLSPSDLLVILDDKDITLGTHKVQSGRGHAGHNGMKSIMETCGTKDITRIRIGIAPEEGKAIEDTSAFVLGTFGMFEKRTLKAVGERIYSDIATWITHH